MSNLNEILYTDILMKFGPRTNTVNKDLDRIIFVTLPKFIKFLNKNG